MIVYQIRRLTLFLMAFMFIGTIQAKPFLENAKTTSESKISSDPQYLKDIIERKFKALPEYPQYLHGTSSGIQGGISDTVIQITEEKRLEDYDTWYKIAIDYRSLAEVQLIQAQRALNAGDIDFAGQCIEESDRNVKIFHSANLAAISIYQANVEQTTYYVKAVYETSRAAFVFTSSFTGLGPIATIASDYLYTVSDFVVNTSESGISYATKQAIIDIVAKEIGKEIISLGEDLIKADYKMNLVTFIRNLAKNPNFEESIKKSIIQETKQYVTEIFVDKLITAIADEMERRSTDEIQTQSSQHDENWGIVLSVPLIKQDTQAGCARACVLMVIKYYFPDLKIDSQFAKSEVPDYAHISEDVIPGISNLSNNQIRGSHFTNSSSNWFDFVKDNIKNRHPVIAVISGAHNLPWWGNRSYKGGHYIVIRGFQNDETIICNDPVDDSKSYIANKEEFDKAWGTIYFKPDGKADVRIPWQGIIVKGIKDQADGLITAIIMDKSGSMSGEKLRRAQEAARAYIDTSQKEDIISLGAFASDAISACEPTNVGEGANELKRNVMSLSADSSTNIGAGLELGYRHLSATNADMKIALLMTDGKNNRGEYETIVSRFQENCWPIYAVAFGRGADLEALSSIAYRTGGLAFPAETVDITQIYQRINIQAHHGSVFCSYNDFLRDNAKLTYSIPVMPDMESVGFFTQWQGSQAKTTIFTPDGSIITSHQLPSNARYIEGDVYHMYEFDNPPSGDWQVQIVGHELPSGGEQVNFHAFCQSGVCANMLPFQPQYQRRKPVCVGVRLAESISGRLMPITNADVKARINKPPASLEKITQDSVSLLKRKKIKTKDIFNIAEDIARLSKTILLYDDGQHHDFEANDGIYANTYDDVTVNGPYVVKVNCDYRTTEGAQNNRELRESFQVGKIKDNPFTLSDFLDKLTK